VSESAVSDKPLLLYGLARNRRRAKRPSEPRPSGVHPEGVEVEEEGAALHFDVGGLPCTGSDLKQSKFTVITGSGFQGRPSALPS
jgi:hypothetical protein